MQSHCLYSCRCRLCEEKYNVKKVLKLDLWKVLLLESRSHFMYVNILESLKFLSIKKATS